MEPTLVERGQIPLVGFSFFGDPFQFGNGSINENEIGRVWSRFRSYLDRHPDHFRLAKMGTLYELHVDAEARDWSGAYEVFVGVEVERVQDVPVEASVKFLPPATYAIFTLQGEDLIFDWAERIGAWLARTEHKLAFPYRFLAYDHRYKGLQRIDESVLDVYVPIRQG